MKFRNWITFKTFDYVFFAITLLILIATWCYIIISFPNLPETIAVHFNAAGQPNGYNTKNSIWVTLIIFTLLIIGFIFGSLYPEQITFPYKKLNEREKKANSKTMLFSANLLSIILFFISLSIIETSLQKNYPTKWITPTLITIIAIYLLGVFYYQLKLKLHD